jgi:hypothetical protein
MAQSRQPFPQLDEAQNRKRHIEEDMADEKKKKKRDNSIPFGF